MIEGACSKHYLQPCGEMIEDLQLFDRSNVENQRLRKFEVDREG